MGLFHSVLASHESIEALILVVPISLVIMESLVPASLCVYIMEPLEEKVSDDFWKRKKKGFVGALNRI